MIISKNSLKDPKLKQFDNFQKTNIEEYSSNSFVQMLSKYVDTRNFIYPQDKILIKKYHEVDLETCSLVNCPKNYGICLDNKRCICNKGYLNIPDLNTVNKEVSCTYQQKKRVISFLLELMIPLGFGHFYAGHYFLGSAKFIVMLILPMIFLIFVNWKYNICSKFVEEFFTFSWYVVITLAFLLDVSFYASGIYKDGNGIPLLV